MLSLQWFREEDPLSVSDPISLLFSRKTMFLTMMFELIFFRKFSVNTVGQVRARPEDCGQRIRNCTTMIRPFLHDLKYMFPTTIQDVEKMCR